MSFLASTQDRFMPYWPSNRFILRWSLTFMSLVIMLCCANGCSRYAYRKAADRQAYQLIQSRQFDHRWDIPDRTVEPESRSRLADLHDPDCGPVPPDDPASECYMRYSFNSRKRVDYWGKRGLAATIDNQQWLQHLPHNEDGEIVLDKELAVELALMHSREFQTQVEQLYFQALDLSSNRFEFMLNWFGGSDFGFQATQDGFDAQRDLSNANELGFSRELATGGQFAANLLNMFTWSFDGSGQSNFSAGSLAFSLTQPLLRGAFRHVRTESLTQSERDMLYAVRNFARFRRQFYFDTVSQYLLLLTQIEAVNIAEDNVALNQLSVEEHEVRLQNELVSPIAADQVFQNFQLARLQLINAQQNLQTSLDQFKFQLGLPARVKIRIDRSLLDPFELNSSEIQQLDQEVRDFKNSINQYLPPEEAPPEFLDQAVEKLRSLSQQVEKLKPGLDAELKQWLDQLEESKPTESDPENKKINHRQQVSLSSQIEKLLDGLDEEIETANETFEEYFGEESETSGQNEEEAEVEEGQDEKEKDVLGDAVDSKGVKKWKKIQDMLALPGGLNDRVSTLLISQTQVRLFLIQIKPLKIEEERAIQIALENRLDLMNSKGAVVDAYRQVEIAADQLESDLNVSASANLNTDPTVDNAFRFDGDENVYTLGVSFDGPLNRLNERNAYRAAQIGYQQQRRAYMADEDSIVNSVRFNLRQLQTNRFSFQIQQQQLITAARQVREAQLNLRRGAGDSSSTQDLLQAFNILRDTKNSLVSSWIAYETSRIALFVDIESLLLDESGKWVNEQEDFGVNPVGSSFDGSGNIEQPRGHFVEQPGEQFNGQPVDDGLDDGLNGAEDIEPIQHRPEFNESIEPPTPEPEAPILDALDSDARSNRRGFGGDLLGRR